MNKIICRVSLLICVAVSVCGCCTEHLSSWNKHSESYQALVKAVDRVKYYPIKVAVFDFDGTIFCERDRTYLDWGVAAWYVQNNADKFTDKDIRIANDVISTGKIPAEDRSFVYRVWAGVPLSEYINSIHDYLDEPMPTTPNLKRRDALFKPMLEVIEYLKDNDFKVFICAETDRWLARCIIPQRLVSSDDIIGSSFEYDVRYFKSGMANLVCTGKLRENNQNEEKILSIINEIGKLPILVFGNSSDDYAMAHMTFPEYVFMVLCDDTERYRGDVEESVSVYMECRKNRWTPISMRNDWKTVYNP